jgi:hypothetical protein
VPWSFVWSSPKLGEPWSQREPNPDPSLNYLIRSDEQLGATVRLVAFAVSRFRINSFCYD